MKRCGSLNSFLDSFNLKMSGLPIKVPYQVLTTGEDACLRFWDLRLAAQTHGLSVALPMEGPVSPESYPTGTENGKPRFVTHRETMRSNFWLPWNSDEQAAFQLFAQPVRWTSSLGQMLMIAWQCCDDDAHDKKSPGICKRMQLVLGMSICKD